MTPEELARRKREAEAPMQAGPEHIGGVADDLSAAFAQDPQFDWFLRADERRDQARNALFRFLLAAVALPDGVVSRPASGGAASIWLPSESMGPTPFLQELRGLPFILSATGLARFPRMVAMREAMDRHHPTDRPHDYLWFLGVRPEAQGLGLGSRLLAAGLAKVDAHGRAAFLESSNVINVPLYQRFGFEVVEEYRARPDAPIMYAMWRDPRT